MNAFKCKDIYVNLFLNVFGQTFCDTCWTQLNWIYCHFNTITAGVNKQDKGELSMYRKENDKKNLREIVGTRIKKARMNKGLTQPELAKMINSSDRNISNYETGYSYPSIEVLRRIAEGLSTSTDYLLGISDSPIIAQGITKADHHLFTELKSEPTIYNFLLDNPETRVKAIYKIWHILDDWLEKEEEKDDQFF